MDENKLLLRTQEPAALTALHSCTPVLAQFGMALREDELHALILRQAQALRSSGRIEFGAGILDRLALAFCDSPYLTHAEFADALGELVELFYALKNETDCFFTDDELAAYMKDAFDNRVHGSLDGLCALSLADLVRRKGDQDRWN